MTDSDFQFFQRVFTAFDAPAYMRRAREVEGTWEILLETCRRKQSKLMEFPRLRLAMLFALLPVPRKMPGEICCDEDFRELESLYAKWSPRLRIPVAPAKSTKAIKTAFEELTESFDRFNRRWGEYLNEINLEPINILRDNYNKYYVLEKECAVFSAAVARQGFEPISPASHAELFEQFPLLRIPGTEKSPDQSSRLASRHQG